MSESEDEALIETLETVWCEATGDIPGPAARVKVKGFLAMQRAYERARLKPCEHDFIEGWSNPHGTQQFCRRCGITSGTARTLTK